MRISRQDAPTVATGFASAEIAAPELAAMAVRAALDSIEASVAGSVLLFLTAHFARSAQAAISAAARQARCLQVVGCTAPGVFTERRWSLDAPAAAALVLCGDTGLVPPGGEAPILTLATPAAARVSAVGAGPGRFGMLSTDQEGEGSGRVWLRGRVSDQGLCEATFSHARVDIGVSRGLRALSPVMAVSAVQGHEILALDDCPALATLVAGLPDELQREGVPLSQLFAAVPEAGLDAAAAMAGGRYRLVPIVNAGEEDQSVALALPLEAGERLFWALRQPATAEHDTGEMLAALADPALDPDFALMFACIGRGPYFFGGEDRDLVRVGERFPGLPVLGAYGAGEIAPLPGGNDFISYSAVTAFVGRVRP